MVGELQALENHLDVLHDQNKALERELDNFMQKDDEIKEQVRSRSPPKKRNSNYAPVPQLNNYRK